MNFTIIERVRERKNISIKELCSRVGISYSGYQRIKKTNEANITTIEKICRILDIDISELWKNENNLQVSEPVEYYRNKVKEEISFTIIDIKNRLDRLEKLIKIIDNEK
ncbi:MAG: helix-turn-helix transcriptional regulator [Bacteroidales bacterium]|nr:helix-turn-helix transcriptional regulator [Bacteroidales bacterium]